MKAGRDLDAIVAEKVMGCKVQEQWANVRGYFCGCEGEKYFMDRPHNRDGGDDALKDYSTDIAAAWEVVDKLGMSRLITIRDGCKPSGAPKGASWGRSHHVTIDGHGESGDSAPHAICLAALKAFSP